MYSLNLTGLHFIHLYRILDDLKKYQKCVYTHRSTCVNIGMHMCVLYRQKVYPSVFILSLKTNLGYKSQLLIDTSLQSFFSYQYSICSATMTLAHLSDIVSYTVYHPPIKHLLNKTRLKEK